MSFFTLYGDIKTPLTRDDKDDNARRLQ